ncbi:MAG: bifunctional hydroxymethylpyrimidine kinase/phosphomethylpyrimidine kinase [Gemmatimonadota bacterium]
MTSVERNRPPVVLTVAGSDSGGGAGVQADLKTFHRYGVFGTSVLTAVTAQSTRGVFGVQRVDPRLVRRQIVVVWEDLRPVACKTGMLVDERIVRAVAETLRELEPSALVVDPVMVAASGSPLLEQGAVAALRELLVPQALLVTPNLPEAERLAGTPVRELRQMRGAAERIAGLGCRAVLLKGGHLPGDEILDLLYADGEFTEWKTARLTTRAGHGTGCTLSAAVTAGLARGDDLGGAVDRAVRFTRRALETAPDLGAGSAPLDHWAPVPDRSPRRS